VNDKQHTYHVELEWTGNRGTGTSGYREYGREHTLRSGHKPEIAASSDPAFRGDAARWNPEDLLVASLSSCHQLWYLHLCTDAGVVVTSYRDEATGSMAETADGSGYFTRVALRPRVEVALAEQVELARRLHHDAHAKCFIANSVNFVVECEASVTAAAASLD
jgi:organic hydroperoxide reductase OsmC/OhrA